MRKRYSAKETIISKIPRGISTKSARKHCNNLEIAQVSCQFVGLDREDLKVITGLNAECWNSIILFVEMVSPVENLAWGNLLTATVVSKSKASNTLGLSSKDRSASCTKRQEYNFAISYNQQCAVKRGTQTFLSI